MDLNKMRSYDSMFAKLSVIFSKSESLPDPFTVQSTLTEGVLGGCEGWGLQKLRREDHRTRMALLSESPSHRLYKHSA